MNYTVFYSWQSDIDNNLNRSFIQDALEKAVKNISSQKKISFDAVVDRDTYGIPGSPSIVESITQKIAKSDVFVCDISIVNSTSEGRLTPNPNVLFELGYASAILGWDRIILVQNIAFGGPEKLSFDLRGRRILSYSIDATSENRSEVKDELKKKLVSIFSGALKPYSGYKFDTKEKIIWWGKWEIDSKIKVRGGSLRITRAASDSFFFKILIFDGARSGDIVGKAQILTPHSAYARISTFEGKFCEIMFRRRLEGDSWCIEIEQNRDCEYFQGMNSTFSGTYKHIPEDIVNRGYLDEIDLNEIERLTGKYITIFLDNFQQHSQYVHNDFNIVEGGVKGMYTIMESIVVVGKSGLIWCACIDPNIEDVVRYFTNSNGDLSIRPQPLIDWLSKFSERKLVVNDRGRDISDDSVLLELLEQSERKKTQSKGYFFKNLVKKFFE
jgi:hypothetical protein